MAFCLRALLGPDWGHCCCQPPGTPPPWSPHMPSPFAHWIALRASHLQLPLQDHGRLYTRWSLGFLISPTLGAPSPFPRRGCLPLFSSGFIGHRQWAWPCQKDPAPPLAFRQSHLARYLSQARWLPSQEQTLSVHIFGGVSSLQRPERAQAAE